jgi:hypothetical protein
MKRTRSKKSRDTVTLKGMSDFQLGQFARPAPANRTRKAWSKCVQENSKGHQELKGGGGSKCIQLYYIKT